MQGLRIVETFSTNGGMARSKRGVLGCKQIGMSSMRLGSGEKYANRAGKKHAQEVEADGGLTLASWVRTQSLKSWMRAVNTFVDD